VATFITAFGFLFLIDELEKARVSQSLLLRADGVIESPDRTGTGVPKLGFTSRNRTRQLRDLPRPDSGENPIEILWPRHYAHGKSPWTPQVAVIAPRQLPAL
jgi:hypothetical protein